MANPPKAKGTGAETELVRKFDEYGLDLVRTPPSTPYDLRRFGDPWTDPFEVLATRPDRGDWLVTLRLEDFAELVREHDAMARHHKASLAPIHVEVKRYKRFSLHSIFEKKFGGKHAEG